MFSFGNKKAEKNRSTAIESRLKKQTPTATRWKSEIWSKPKGDFFQYYMLAYTKEQVAVAWEWPELFWSNGLKLIGYCTKLVHCGKYMLAVEEGSLA